MPLNRPGKYWVVEPPRGAPGLMLIMRMYIEGSVEAKLDGDRGSIAVAFLSTGMGTRAGHSHWRPAKTVSEKFEACVQVVRSGDV